MKKHPLQENYERFFGSKSRIGEASSKINIKNVDSANLNTNAENIVKAFYENGFRGTYDPETTVGLVEYNGVQIEFITGNENLYIEIKDRMMTKEQPYRTVKKLKEFLDFISEWK